MLRDGSVDSVGEGEHEAVGSDGEHGERCDRLHRRLKRIVKARAARDLADSVSGHKRGDLPEDPVDPSLKTKVIRLEVRPEAFALWRQLQQVLEKEKGERLDDTALVEAVAGAYLCGGGEKGGGAAAY